MKTMTLTDEQHAVLREALDQFVSNTDEAAEGDLKLQRQVIVAETMLNDLNADISLLAGPLPTTLPKPLEQRCLGCHMVDGKHVDGCRAANPPRGLNPNPCACMYCDRTVGKGGLDFEMDGLITYAHIKCHKEQCE